MADYERYVNYKSARCRLTISERRQQIRVTSLYSSAPGRGNGTELMRMVCAIADEMRMELHLIANAARTGPLTNLQLQKFYEKFGFVYLENGRMRRQPQHG